MSTMVIQHKGFSLHKLLKLNLRYFREGLKPIICFFNNYISTAETFDVCAIPTKLKIQKQFASFILLKYIYIHRVKK